MIVGFCGETEEDHLASLDSIQGGFPKMSYFGVKRSFLGQKRNFKSFLGQNIVILGLKNWILVIFSHF